MNSGKRIAPFILAMQGMRPTAEELECFKQINPLGFIFFQWNLENPKQLTAVMNQLRDLLDRSDILFVIDGEGGRVWRLPPAFGETPPTAASYGARYAADPADGIHSCFEGFRNIGNRLKSLGFHMNMAPVLDLKVPGAHTIIGDRAFSENPEDVTCLGLQAIYGLIEEGMTPVMKHVPGHGASIQDSHKACPVIHLTPEELAKHLVPFTACASEVQWAMTAHITYPELDDALPVTFSKKIIQEVIRGQIGFQGNIMTDDLFMKGAALFSPQERTYKAFEAGCDVALWCKGGPLMFQEAFAGWQLFERNQ